MKKQFSLSLILFLLSGFIFVNFSSAANLATKLKGKILLQVEQNGEAWYVNPANESRYFMGRPDDAFSLMRSLGVGISNNDLQKIQIADENLSGTDDDNDGLSNMIEDSLGTNKLKTDSDGDGYDDKLEILNGYDPNGVGKKIDDNFAQKQSGKILLQVESNGEAWYMNPKNNKRYFLGRPDDAFSVMRKLGLGITNNDLNLIVAKSNSNNIQNNHPISNSAAIDEINKCKNQYDDEEEKNKCIGEVISDYKDPDLCDELPSKYVYACKLHYKSDTGLDKEYINQEQDDIKLLSKEELDSKAGFFDWSDDYFDMYNIFLYSDGIKLVLKDELKELYKESYNNYKYQRIEYGILIGERKNNNMAIETEITDLSNAYDIICIFNLEPDTKYSAWPMWGITKDDYETNDMMYFRTKSDNSLVDCKTDKMIIVQN